MAYSIVNWNELTLYAPNGRIEIDKNLVEKGIGKKNWLFIGDVDTAQRSAIISTLIECCRRRGIDPEA